MVVTRLYLFIMMSLGIPLAAQAAVDDEIYCMASIIKAEANGESNAGKAYVGGTIKERIKRGYGKSACKLSGFARRKGPYSEAVISAAQKAKPNGITHFHSYKSQRTSNASWSVKKDKKGKFIWTFVVKEGGHWFFNAPSYAKASSFVLVSDDFPTGDDWKYSVETPEEEAMVKAGEQYFPAELEPSDEWYENTDILSI